MIRLTKAPVGYLYVKEKRAVIKALLLKELGGVCVDCGATDRLHFDHIDPATKLFDVSQQLTSALPRLLLEVRKCQLLCGSCHGKKTATDHNGPTAHGKLSMYTNGKCRCNKCKKINAEYNRIYKRKHKYDKRHDTNI